MLHTPKFSKFLHGGASLHPDLVESFPYWFLPDGQGGMTPATWDEMADKRDPYLKVSTSTKKLNLASYERLLVIL